MSEGHLTPGPEGPGLHPEGPGLHPEGPGLHPEGPGLRDAGDVIADTLARASTDLPSGRRRTERILSRRSPISRAASANTGR